MDLWLWLVLAAWLIWVFRDRTPLLRQSHDLYLRHLADARSPAQRSQASTNAQIGDTDSNNSKRDHASSQ